MAVPASVSTAAPAAVQAAAEAVLAVAVAVIAAALFGSATLSERAFRLLRWIANRPEPPAPEPAETRRN